MQQLFEHIARFQEKRPILILTLFALLTFVLSFYAVGLETDASFDTMFGPQSDHVIMKNMVSAEYGSTDTLYILVTINDEVDDRQRIQDIRHPQVLQSMDQLKRSVLEEKAVSEVTSVVDVLKELGPLPNTLEESKEVFNALPDNIKDLMVAKDYSALNMIVEMDVANKPGSLERAEGVIAQKINDAAQPLGVHIILAGEPTLINRIMTLLINDNLKTVAIAIVFIFFIMFAYFRSPLLAFIASVPLLISLVWLAATMNLFNLRITFMTAAVGSMMVGMGIDYSIHMTHGYLQALKKGLKHPTVHAVGLVGSALTASAATTVAGFLAMLFGDSPSSRIQGTVLSLGIGFAFLATTIVLPCLLVLYRKYALSDFDTVVYRLGVKQKEERSILYTPLSLLAKLQTKQPWLIIGVFAIATILILPGMGRLWMDTSNENWIPPGDPVMAALDEIGHKFGGLDTQTFLVSLDPDEETSDVTDLRDPTVLKKVAALDRAMEEHELVNTFRSPTDLIKEQHGSIPSEIERVKQIIAQDPEIRSYFNQDYSLIRLTAFGDDFGGGPSQGMLVSYNEWLYEAEGVSFPTGVKYEAQGGVRSDLELDQLLAQDTVKTTMIGFLFVFLLALLIYRSFTVGALSILPIILSILWTVGIMGWVNLPFTVLTSGMMAIVMGMGIDFSIHLIHNARSFLAKGQDITSAITNAVTSTGEAISVTTLTTVVGFCSLTLATLLATQRLGLTLAIAVFSAFVICLLIVPTTLVIEHTLKNRKQPQR